VCSEEPPNGGDPPGPAIGSCGGVIPSCQGDTHQLAVARCGSPLAERLVQRSSFHVRGTKGGGGPGHALVATQGHRGGTQLDLALAE
jgi:hypothetical protein